MLFPISDNSVDGNRVIIASNPYISPVGENLDELATELVTERDEASADKVAVASDPIPMVLAAGATDADPMHEIGREGVRIARRYLDSTTRLTVPFDVSDEPQLCKLLMLDGTNKQFDLSGFFFEPKRFVYVEAKKYSASRDQGTKFSDFLAHACSCTARSWLDLGTDPQWEFIWLTWHPFALGRWQQLLSRDELRTAITGRPELLGGYAVNEQVIEEIADRLWLLVLHDKQTDLMPDPGEIMDILVALRRHPNG